MRAIRTSPLQMTVYDLPRDVPMGIVRAGLTLYANYLQRLIRMSFKREMTAELWMFRPNTPEYTLEKIKKGLSPKRGKATGHLERALLRPLFTITPIVGGTAHIVFHEGMLRHRAKQAKWFARKKVTGMLILALNPRWAFDRVGIGLIDRPIVQYRRAQTTRARYQVNPSEQPVYSTVTGAQAAAAAAAGNNAAFLASIAHLTPEERFIKIFGEAVRTGELVPVGPDAPSSKAKTAFEKAQEAAQAKHEKLLRFEQVLRQVERADPRALEVIMQKSPATKRMMAPFVPGAPRLAADHGTAMAETLQVAASDKRVEQALRRAEKIIDITSDTFGHMRGSNLAVIARRIVNITIQKLRFWRRRR